MVGGVLDGRYRVLGKLGSGAMGEVFSVEHLESGQPQALKILHGFLARDAELAGRFRREARAIGRLQHPGIVAIYDFGVLPGGRPFLTMERVEGESLAGRLRARGRPSIAVALALLGELAAAIDHAHGQGVVHRDLKPENLMLRAGSDRVVVLDFGVAKIVAPDYQESLAPTPLGEVFGSAPYMAPEQFGLGSVTARCDLYAIGCIGYELCTGVAPFSGGRIDLMHAHLTRAPIAPRQRCPEAEIPVALEELLLRCMDKDPGRRFASGGELGRALAAVG